MLSLCLLLSLPPSPIRYFYALLCGFADAWTAHAGSLVTPNWWDSRLCLEHWGRPELQTKTDPNGYVVFVSGA